MRYLKKFANTTAAEQAIANQEIDDASVIIASDKIRYHLNTPGYRTLSFPAAPAVEPVVEPEEEPGGE